MIQLNRKSVNISIILTIMEWYDKSLNLIFFVVNNLTSKLFLDDSRMKNFTTCFKEKQFLNFFFRNVKLNSTGRLVFFCFVF